MIRFLAILAMCASLQAADRIVEVSAYCPCRVCCGPLSPRPTTSGRWPRQGRTVAHNLVPLGTKLTIRGVGERVVEDRTHPKYGHRIDLFMDSHAAAKRWGVRKLKVTVKKGTI